MTSKFAIIVTYANNSKQGKYENQFTQGQCGPANNPRRD